MLTFVLIDANAWMGDCADALAAIATIEEAHIIAGAAAVLVKVRTASTEQLQEALREIFDIDGVTGTQAIVVLETFFERPLDPREPPDSSDPRSTQRFDARPRRRTGRAGP
ncbi:MAG TPA: Lrp/AsnC ligand binding domain-containing protein [Jatrophihabitantaceae bacterium]